MTHLLYRDDPGLLEFEASVVRRREYDGQPAVVLDHTAFFPEGGGQPSDSGRLGEARVSEVLEVEGEILHVLDIEIPQGRVTGSVDAARRRDHTQQHHGQHLLSRAFVETATAATMSFHLGAEESSIDLDHEVSPAQIRAAEALANEVVWQARPVSTRLMQRREAEQLGLAPAEHAGETIRVVEVDGFDRQACSGTHPANTGEVGVILLLGQERYKGGSRIQFVCGTRAVTAFRERARAVERLGALFSAPLAALPEAAEKILDRLEELEHRSRQLLDAALDGEAHRLLEQAEGSPPLIVASFDARPADELRQLALKLTLSRPSVALFGSRGPKAHLVFAQSKGLPCQIPALLKQAAEKLGGRGGGRGDIAQGGGSQVEHLQEALDEAAAAARSQLGT